MLRSEHKIFYNFRMTFFTCFRPVQWIVVSLVIFASSGCLTIKPNENHQNTLSAHHRHVSKIIYPAADRRPYIETTHAQLGKMRWLVDSGATHSIIFDHGKKPMDTIITKNLSSSNHVHGMFITKSKKLSLFYYQADGIPTLTGYVMEPQTQKLHSRADGIMGMNSLRLYNTVMLPRQKILLWNSHKTHVGAGAKINLRQHAKSGHLIATLQHGVHDLHLILDTGASKSVIDYSSAKKIKSAYKARAIRLSGAHQSRTNNLSISKLKIRFAPSQPVIAADFVVTDLSNLRKNLNSTHDLPIDGILGYDLIGRYFDAIDFGRGLLYLHPN